MSTKVPGLSERVQRQAVALIQKLRHEDLLKPPGVAETLDWAQKRWYTSASRSSKRPTSSRHSASS